MNAGIILAAGSGSRLGGDTPKQFLRVAGKMVIEHTVDVFERHPGIDVIIIVTNPVNVGFVEEIVRRNGYSKVEAVLPGGAERYHSSLSAIKHFSGDDTKMIFHDAVRPMVTERIITDCIDALDRFNAADVVIPTTDTIIQADPEDNTIASVPPRALLRNGQTPQAFRLGTIRRAYEKAMLDPALMATDDCGIVKKYLPEEKIFLVRGEVSNMKITYKEDLPFIEKLLLGREEAK